MSGLILSRGKGESVRIGDEIQVRILEIRGTKVRLQFIAPENVAIHREEVYEIIESKK